MTLPVCVRKKNNQKKNQHSVSVGSDSKSASILTHEYIRKLVILGNCATVALTNNAISGPLGFSVIQLRACGAAESWSTTGCHHNLLVNLWLRSKARLGCVTHSGVKTALVFI